MPDKRLWRITPHVCQRCLARVLVTESKDGKQTARCSNCGLEAEGGHKAICACGLKLKSGKSAGLKCIPNPKPSAEMPSEVVASAL